MKNLQTFDEFLNEAQLNEDAKDKIPAAQLAKIGEVLTKVCKNYSGSYWKTLFDHTQTHAIYGTSKSDYDRLKATLTGLGAKKFRTVKAHAAGLIIVCFDATKIS